MSELLEFIETWQHVISAAALVVTVAGFTIAFWQLKQTQNATEAAVEAVEETERRLAVNRLLGLQAEFGIQEQELDLAADENDRNKARAALIGYRRAASEVSILLQNLTRLDDKPNDPEVQKLLGQLAVSTRDAARTKAKIVTDKVTEVSVLTEKIRVNIADVTSTVSEVIMSIGMQGGSP